MKWWSDRRRKSLELRDTNVVRRGLQKISLWQQKHLVSQSVIELCAMTENK